MLIGEVVADHPSRHCEDHIRRLMVDGLAAGRAATAHLLTASYRRVIRPTRLLALKGSRTTLPSNTIADGYHAVDPRAC